MKHKVNIGDIEKISILRAEVGKLRKRVDELQADIDYRIAQKTQLECEMGILRGRNQSLADELAVVMHETKYDASLLERYDASREKCAELEAKIRRLEARAVELESKATLSADLQKRVAEWEQAKRERRDVHHDSSRENVQLRKERTRLLLAMAEAADRLQGFKDQEVQTVCHNLLEHTRGA